MTWPAAGRSGNLSHGPGRPDREWNVIPDMRRCAGWLLWSCRMASPLGSVPVKELVPQLEALGLSESQVSRIEHGKVAMSLETIRSYERLLELPYGRLQSPLLALARTVEGTHNRRWLELESTPDERADWTVDEIFDAVEDGAAVTGARWLRLAHLIAAGGCESVPTRVLHRWTRQLISEMMRGASGGYFPRLEAASTLAAHDRTAPMVLRAVQELTSVAGVSGAYDAWSIVGDIRNRSLFDQLIAPLPTVQESTFRAFCSALTQPLFDERLTKEQVARIADACAARLPTASRDTVQAIDWIAVCLPEPLGGPLLHEIDRRRPQTRTAITHEHRELDAELEVYMRHATEDAWPGRPDGQLEALLRVVLVGDNFGQRFHAGSLLWASPYADALTEAALEIAQSRDFDAAAQDVATYLITRTARSGNADSLRTALHESARADVRNACLMALAHTCTLGPQDDLAPFFRDADLRWSAIYAAGITGHPQLDLPEADSPEARWWLSVGPGFWQ